MAGEALAAYLAGFLMVWVSVCDCAGVDGTLKIGDLKKMIRFPT